MRSLILGLGSLLGMSAGMGNLPHASGSGDYIDRSGFSNRFGCNPRSLNGSYRVNSNAAAQKRAAKKRRNIAKKVSRRG